jgi:hypothetical protein
MNHGTLPLQQTTRKGSNSRKEMAMARVVIEQDRRGDWQIVPHANDMADMRSRREKHRAELIDKWKGRKGKNGKPHWADEPDHPSIVAASNEMVTFECVQPFAIWVGADPDVEAQGNATNPFGWTTPRLGDMNTLVSARVAIDASAQIFYKCCAAIFDGTKFVTVDPDMICGF